jgi:hypothetical protein
MRCGGGWRLAPISARDQKAGKVWPIADRLGSDMLRRDGHRQAGGGYVMIQPDRERCGHCGVKSGDVTITNSTDVSGRL